MTDVSTTCTIWLCRNVSHCQTVKPHSPSRSYSTNLSVWDGNNYWLWKCYFWHSMGNRQNKLAEGRCTSFLDTGTCLQGTDWKLCVIVNWNCFVCLFFLHKDLPGTVCSVATINSREKDSQGPWKIAVAYRTSEKSPLATNLLEFEVTMDILNGKLNIFWQSEHLFDWSYF